MLFHYPTVQQAVEELCSVGRISLSVSDDASPVRRMGQVVIDSFPKSVRTFPYNHKDRDSVPVSFLLYTVSKGTALPVVV